MGAAITGGTEAKGATATGATGGGVAAIGAGIGGGVLLPALNGNAAAGFVGMAITAVPSSASSSRRNDRCGLAPGGAGSGGGPGMKGSGSRLGSTRAMLSCVTRPSMLCDSFGRDGGGGGGGRCVIRSSSAWLASSDVASSSSVLASTKVGCAWIGSIAGERAGGSTTGDIPGRGGDRSAARRASIAARSTGCMPVRGVTGSSSSSSSTCAGASGTPICGGGTARRRSR